MLTSTSQSDSIVVSAQHPADCMDDCLALLNATRQSENVRQRFEWLYLQNPDGPAMVWLAREGDANLPVGFAAVLPRRMLVLGNVVRGWNCCDLSVLPEFRRLGVATALRQQARLGVDRGDAELLYGHPNNRAAGAHRAVGHVPLGTMKRTARPMSLRPYLTRVLRSRTLAAWIDRVAGPFWKPRRRSASAPASHVVEIRGNRFDERFDALFQRVARLDEVIGIRDAAYLNWRYADNPLYRTDALLLSDADCLRGYLVYSISDSMLIIRDLLVESREAATALVEEALQIALRESVESISFTALETHPAHHWLSEFGFRQRPETSQAFVYTALQGEAREAILSAEAWFMSVGDRDV